MRRSFKDSMQQAELASKRGNYITRDSARVLPIPPVWNISENAQLKPSYNTIFRILPTVERNGSFSQFRYSADEMNYGDWIRAYPMFKGGVNETAQFIIGDDFQSVTTAPSSVLRRYVQQQARAQVTSPHLSLVEKKDARAAKLPAWDTRCLLLGAIVERDTFFASARDGLSAALGLDPALPAHLLVLSKDCADTMLKQLDRYNATYGNPLDLNTGAFVTLYPGKYPPTVTAARRGERVEIETTYGFGCMAGQQCITEVSMNPAVPIELLNIIHSKFDSWDTTLRIPSYPEQASILASVFPPDLLVAAWNAMGCSQWIDDALRQRFEAWEASQKATVTSGFSSSSAPAPGYTAPGRPAFGANTDGSGSTGEYITPPPRRVGGPAATMMISADSVNSRAVGLPQPTVDITVEQRGAELLALLNRNN